MKSSAFVLVMLLLVCGAAIAGDYIRIGVDSIPAGATNFEIPFYVEHTCGQNSPGIANGFIMIAEGAASWSFVDYVPCPQHFYWFSLGGLLLMNHIDGMASDSFLVGGTGYSTTGLPWTTDTILFSLFLDIGPSEGALLIDSAYVFSGGHWRFSGMTCGLGGAPNRPLFVDKYGSDANHPIVITVYEPICGDANLDGAVDIDDPVFLLNYIFLYGPAPNPYLKSDCDCSRGDVPVDIDDIVHLMNYILRDGPEPCDVDGDGVPDC
jgi:hypothetical protein